MKNTADATPRSYVFGIIIFTLLIVGGISIFASFGAVNPSMVTSTKYEQFNNTFNKFSDLNESVTNLQSSIESDDNKEFGVFGVLNGLINAAWNSLKLIFQSFGFMSDVGDGLNKVFGVPSWIPNLLFLSVITMLAFTIWSAIFQSEL